MQITVARTDGEVVELLWAGRVRGLLTLCGPDDGRQAGWRLSCDGQPAVLIAGFDGDADAFGAWSVTSRMYAQTVAQGRVGQHVLAGFPQRRAARAARRRRRR